MQNVFMVKTVVSFFFPSFFVFTNRMDQDNNGLVVTSQDVLPQTAHQQVTQQLAEVIIPSYSS
jgi:hypothetical protein